MTKKREALLSRCGIYKIENIINNHIYIGSSANISHRWQHHKWDLKNNKHANSRLQRAWNLYGEKHFTFSILEICEESDLLLREQFYIDSLKPNYNLLPLAGRTAGIIRSEKYKKKFIGNKHALGYKHTEEEIEKIRNSSIGRKRSPESIEKQRLRNIGNKYSLGKKREDSRIRMIGNKYGLGIKKSEETKLKQSMAMKKYWASQRSIEHRENNRIAMIGNKLAIGRS